jgi:hydroxymethylpyrimidine pyrophosphatase-like HAD family hydrolase
MRRILLFDIDGTIAESSKSVGPEMKTAIRKKVAEGWDVGIVGGGKLDKALSQLGDLEMNVVVFIIKVRNSNSYISKTYANTRSIQR